MNRTIRCRGGRLLDSLSKKGQKQKIKRMDCISIQDEIIGTKNYGTVKEEEATPTAGQ